jgi:hypothetical protein
MEAKIYRSGKIDIGAESVGGLRKRYFSSLGGSEKIDI